MSMGSIDVPVSSSVHDLFLQLHPAGVLSSLFILCGVHPIRAEQRQETAQGNKCNTDS